MGKKESNPGPPGKRDDGGKMSWHLIPVPGMVEFCKVWHAGGLKYGAENWRGGLAFTRVYRPMMSHLNKWLCGKGSYDKELGTHHLMMVAWGCFVLYMYEIVFGREDLDDRPDKGLLNDEDFEYDNIVDVVMGQKMKVEEDRLRREDEKQRNRDWKDFREEDWENMKKDKDRWIGEHW
jgi:hypothetical protein